MKKTVSILLSLVMVLSAFSVMPFPALAQTSGDWQYELLQDNTAEITGYSGSATDITIPKTLDGHTVTQIGDSALENKSFKNVVISGNVKTICDRAFAWNGSLTSLTIENGVENIEGGAFVRCSGIKNLYIPGSVKSIDGYAFYGCSALETIEVDKDNKVYDSRDNCNAIVETVNKAIITACRNTVIPDTVESLNNYVNFGEGVITSISIPKSLKHIESYVFGDEDALKDVYYSGTKAQWGAIDIMDGNSNLFSAVIHCTDGDMVNSIYTKALKSAAFVPAKAKKVIQYTNGWGEYDDSFSYGAPKFEEGDKIVLTYEDDSSEDFVYTDVDNGYWYEFKNASNISLEDVYGYDISGLDGFSGLGSTTYSITLNSRIEEFSFKISDIPVEVIENPIEYAEYVGAKPITIVEKTNGTDTGDEDTYKYYAPDLNDGDKIILHYRNGTSKVCTCKEEKEEYYGKDAYYYYVACYDSDGKKIFDGDDGLNSDDAEFSGLGTVNFKYKLTDLGIEFSVPVEIVESPVKSISVSDSKIKYSTKINDITGDGWSEYNTKGVYDLTVQYKDNTSKVFENISLDDMIDNICIVSSMDGTFKVGENVIDVEYAGAKAQTKLNIVDDVTVNNFSLRQTKKITDGFESKEDGGKAAVYWVNYIKKYLEFTINYSDGTSYTGPYSSLGFWDADPPCGDISIRGNYYTSGTFSTENHYAADGNVLTVDICGIEKKITVSGESAPHKHSYSAAVTKAATCGTDGVKTFTCACGDTYTEKIPATNKHSYDAGRIIKTTSTQYVKTFTCKICKHTYKKTYNKSANPLSTKAKKPTVKYSKLKKKNQTVALKSWVTVSKAKGKVTYKKSSGNKKIAVASNGKITVKKGLKKGTYTVKIKVTAAGNSTYKAKTNTVTLKINVK